MNYDPNSAGDYEEYEFFKHMEKKQSGSRQHSSSPSFGDVLAGIVLVFLLLLGLFL